MGRVRADVQKQGSWETYQSSCGSVGILECPPHFLADIRQLLQVLVPIFTQFVIHQAFGILPLAVSVVLVTAVADYVGHDAEEGQLLVIAREALVFRVVQLPRTVVV